MSEKIRAVGLISGGLDSTLATQLLLNQGIEVLGVNFNTGFCLTDHRRQTQKPGEDKKKIQNEALQAGAQLQFPVDIVDISEEYWQVLTRPKYGYGKAINPCIDCRIKMFSRAKEYMLENDAHFVFSGEVIGQRPMTQHAPTQKMIARQSGLEGLLLRPLSAKIMAPTIPELKGWVDREKLKGFHGRNRKPQMQLADDLKVTEYPQPAGGCCFLTDQNYAVRMRDLFEHNMDLDEISRDEVLLLKVGRHFRIADKIKVIVGRNEGENNFLERYKKGRIAICARDHSSPTSLVDSSVSEYELLTAAAITARYGDCPPEKEAVMLIERDSKTEELTIIPSKPDDIELMRV